MIEIKEYKEQLLLCYLPETPPYDWVQKGLDENNYITIAKAFHFTKSDLIVFDEDDEYVTEEESCFILAVSEGNYYKINSEILGTKKDIFLSKDMPINRKTFIAQRGISIFSKIDQLIDENIVIGGNKDKAIPIEDFNLLLKNFPTSTELNHYTNSRISIILKEYLGTMTDAQEKLSDFLKKKKTVNASSLNKTSEIKELYEYEIEKYAYIRDRIKEMLKESKNYSEDEWQKLMLKFILLIFPKYISVLENIHIKDYYSKANPTNRYIDLGLVDANGNLDIIEIKKPFDNCLLSNSKYRGNYTPKKELSGTIMQAEKYLFHLNKWGVIGEKKITEKHVNNLPTGMSIKITSPKALIIIGRSKDFVDDQNFDFEIMKRKYANIIDIITYDDLLMRLENIINKFKKM